MALTPSEFDGQEIIFETQTISTTGMGFDGTKKETQLTLPDIKSGYKAYVLNAEPNVYSKDNYIYFRGNANAAGKFYIEHNLLSTCTQIHVPIAWVKN